MLCENSKKLLPTILSRSSVFRLKTKDVFSEDAVAGAKKIVKGILSTREYNLMQALYALSDKNLADEILLVVKLILRDGMALERMRFLTKNVPGSLQDDLLGQS